MRNVNAGNVKPASVMSAANMLAMNAAKVTAMAMSSVNALKGVAAKDKEAVLNAAQILDPGNLFAGFLLYGSAPGKNGGWLPRATGKSRGAQLARGGNFKSFCEAAAFPKTMLHSSIADKVWLGVARGDLADAVFVAFRTVEEAARHAGGFALAGVGTILMRKAFDKVNGPHLGITALSAAEKTLAPYLQRRANQTRLAKVSSLG